MLIPNRPRVRPDLIFREIEGDFVLYDPVTDRTALLNASAAAILDLCDGSRTLDDITMEIVRRFDAGKESVGQEVEKVLRKVASRGLLERATEQ